MKIDLEAKTNPIKRNDNMTQKSAQQENEIIILRGLPGSGKSKLAKDNLSVGKNTVVLSTDDYFYKDGVYNFDPDLNVRMHAANQMRCILEMLRGTERIIIDNTNILLWQVRRYVAIAKQMGGYKIEIVHVNTNLSNEALAERNVHGVPVQTIARMRHMFESLDPVETVIRGTNVVADPEDRAPWVTLSEIRTMRKFHEAQIKGESTEQFTSNYRAIRELVRLERQQNKAESSDEVTV